MIDQTPPKSNLKVDPTIQDYNIVPRSPKLILRKEMINYILRCTSQLIKNKITPFVN